MCPDTLERKPIPRLFTPFIPFLIPFPCGTPDPDPGNNKEDREYDKEQDVDQVELHRAFSGGVMGGRLCQDLFRREQKSRKGEQPRVQRPEYLFQFFHVYIAITCRELFMRKSGMSLFNKIPPGVQISHD